MKYRSRKDSVPRADNDCGDAQRVAQTSLRPVKNKAQPRSALTLGARRGTASARVAQLLAATPTRVLLKMIR